VEGLAKLHADMTVEPVVVASSGTSSGDAAPAGR
jgi:hypothetical protein